MKSYFLAFDFYIDYKNINKFDYSVVQADLQKTQLPDIAKQIVVDNYPELDIAEVTIKVTAFNNIDL